MTTTTTTTVINPVTGRAIRVGGPTFRRLEAQQHEEGASAVQRQRRRQRQPGSKAKHTGAPANRASSSAPLPLPTRFMSLREVYEHYAMQPAVHRAMKKHVESAAKRHHHQGSVTRGWIGAKPTTLAERREVYHRCGDACFLQPDTLGFPVCPKKATRNLASLPHAPDACFRSCQAIQSAYRRARQWKHEEVAREADALRRKHCGVDDANTTRRYHRR